MLVHGATASNAPAGGQVADIFLVFDKLDEKLVTCLVPRESAGLEVEPIRNMLGFSAAGMAGLRFHDVAVPGANIVGKPGFAFSHVVPVAMHIGRISTAWSALGFPCGRKSRRRRESWRARASS